MSVISFPNLGTRNVWMWCAPAGRAAGGQQLLTSANGASASKKNTSRRNAWGNLSYADLITQAISSSAETRLTLSQIYEWMVQNVPYFKDKGDSNSSAGWKVSHSIFTLCFYLPTFLCSGLATQIDFRCYHEASKTYFCWTIRVRFSRDAFLIVESRKTTR